MSLDVGQPAPDLALRIETGETRRLADYRGQKNVVLAFYTRDHGNN